jgi:hypothetical protein
MDITIIVILLSKKLGLVRKVTIIVEAKAMKNSVCLVPTPNQSVLLEPEEKKNNFISLI